MTAFANKLFYGDNLALLRESIADESVDLIYLDPPFNSNATYNILFKALSGEKSPAQIEAFDDTWHWNDSAERAFDEVLTGKHSDAAVMLKAMRSALGENDMMAVRLIELHRVLKPTGSLYLHCDPVASHHLKLLLDAIFGLGGFLNKVIWKGAETVKGNFGQAASSSTEIPIVFCFMLANPTDRFFTINFDHIQRDILKIPTSTWSRTPVGAIS